MLLIEKTTKEIDLTEIARGNPICARHRTWGKWDSWKSGLVSDVSEKQIIVTFLPETQNIQNHFIISAADIAAGAWEIRWSSDGLETVKTVEGGSDDGT